MRHAEGVAFRGVGCGEKQSGSSSGGGRRGGWLGLTLVVLGSLAVPGVVAAERSGCDVVAPGTLSAQSTADGAIALQWDDVPMAFGYQIFNLAQGSIPVATVPGFITFYEDASVPQCEEQTYTVRAFGHDSCLSGPSPLASALPVALGPEHESADFDGDGATDPSVYDPSSGLWTWQPSGGGATEVLNWGQAGDLPVAADYDGDGKTDPAIFRPSTGEWWILASCGSRPLVTPFGQAEDVPVPADYDGDGKADVATYRPSTQQWWIQRSSDGSSSAASVGSASDVPVPGDYDGDGRADLAFYRPATSQWQLLRSSDGGIDIVALGSPGDRPAPADYDGDGRTDPAVLTAGDALWRILFLASTPGGEDHAVITPVIWPVPGDYDPSSPGAEMMVIVEGATDHAWIEESSKGVVEYAFSFGSRNTWPIPGLLLALVP